jgi:hypothetical protein
VIWLRRIPDVRGANDIENQAVAHPTPRVGKSAGLQGMLGPDQLARVWSLERSSRACEGEEVWDLQVF